MEIHPRLAERYGVKDGDALEVATRRGSLVLPAKVVTTIRPDTVFIPYHWPGKLAANQLTGRFLDPVSKIPEFKVSACRLKKVPLDQLPEELRELQRMAAQASSAQAHLPERVM